MEGRICHLKTIRVKGGQIVHVNGHGYDLHCTKTYCDTYGICPWSNEVHRIR